MNNQIKIDDKVIDYKVIKSKRAKRLRVAVYCNTGVVVTLPHKESVGVAEKFLKQKASWLLEKVSFFKSIKNSKLADISKDDFTKNKDKAYQLAQKTVNKFNKEGRFQINKVLIKNQKTRWGSCSRKGNINLNYKIIYLPTKLVNYIVVHELCHLEEFSHSRKFWNLVEEILPDYLKIKKQLKEILYN